MILSGGFPDLLSASAYSSWDEPLVNTFREAWSLRDLDFAERNL